MNNTLYPNYSNPITVPGQGGTQPPIQNVPGVSLPNMNDNVINYPASNPPYAEDLLALNRGKIASFYMSYSDSVEWRDRVFTGVIEDSGRDYALVSDPKTGKWTILWLVYLNFVEFDEPIKHNSQ